MAAQLVELRIRAIFYHTGRFIARRPYALIAVFTLLTVVLSTGALNFREVNNVRDHFSADNSPSRYEYAVAREFFREHGSPFHVVVAMRAADHGSLLRPGYIDEVLRIEHFLQYELSVITDETSADGNRTYAWSDLCGSQCETSDSVHYFLTMYRDMQTRRGGINSTQAINVKLTYPTMDLFGEKIYLANNLYSVVVNNRSQLIDSVGLVAINFHAVYSNASVEAVLKRWEQAVFEYMLAHADAPLVRVFTTSEGLVSREVRRTGMSALPLMSVSFVVILIFTVSTCLHYDPTRSKPWEAFMGVLCPLISLVASFGSMFLLGFEFLPIVSVVPFLILAVGVDDVFILLHCWHKTSTSASVDIRMAETLMEAGPSITITSLTNLLSFLVGAFSPTPAIRVFCLFIANAVVMDYLYQIFFFSSILVIGGRREAKGQNAYYGCCIPAKKKVTDESIKKQVANPEQHRTMNMLLDYWTDISMSRWARVIVVITLIVYWAMSIGGVLQVRIGLSSEKLFLDDSPLLELVRIQNNIIFKEGGQLAVFVNAPGDLRAPTAIGRIMRMLDRFERAPKSVGATSTHIFLHTYLPFIGLQNHGQIEFAYKYLPEFLDIAEYRRWNHFVSIDRDACILDDAPACLQRFFFTTGFRNAVAWADRLDLLMAWRAIADDYREYNVTVYEDFAMYADQILSIGPATKQTVLFALVCMTLVCILFTPNVVSVVCSTLSILSINIGVFGSLTYWNVDLDPISMATILMSIGFSVDFIAHISYHYFKGDVEDGRERLRLALSSIAWPMLQAALSTVLSLLVLAIVHAYMVQVFVKVVCLVVFLGLAHGLVILPVIFAALPFHKSSSSIRPSTTTVAITDSPVPTNIHVNNENSTTTTTTTTADSSPLKSITIVSIVKYKPDECTT